MVIKFKSRSRARFFFRARSLRIVVVYHYENWKANSRCSRISWCLILSCLLELRTRVTRIIISSHFLTFFASRKRIRLELIEKFDQLKEPEHQKNRTNVIARYLRNGLVSLHHSIYRYIFRNASFNLSTFHISSNQSKYSSLFKSSCIILTSIWSFQVLHHFENDYIS